MELTQLIKKMAKIKKKTRQSVVRDENKKNQSQECNFMIGDDRSADFGSHLSCTMANPNLKNVVWCVASLASFLKCITSKKVLRTSGLGYFC